MPRERYVSKEIGGKHLLFDADTPLGTIIDATLAEQIVRGLNTGWLGTDDFYSCAKVSTSKPRWCESCRNQISPKDDHILVKARQRGAFVNFRSHLACWTYDGFNAEGDRHAA
jgi:hypothetical protein